MKAMVYRGNRKLDLEEVPDPVAGYGEVVIKVDYCGICATDIEEYIYGPNFIDAHKSNMVTGEKMPFITGHEITGTVSEVGAETKRDLLGKRVVIDGILSCKKCSRCDAGDTSQCLLGMAAVGFACDGGLAEYMKWPSDQVIVLPDNVTSVEAALVEPASVAMHAVDKANIIRGHKVVIIGAGTVGLLSLQLAKNIGAYVSVIDVREVSLSKAIELGADKVINASMENVTEFSRNVSAHERPDVVIDAAGGRDTADTAIDLVRNGGRVVLVAIYSANNIVDFNKLVGTEKEVVGSLAYVRRDVERVVNLLTEGKLHTKPLVSEVISLDEVKSKGFERMMSPDKDIFRILVKPSR